MGYCVASYVNLLRVILWRAVVICFAVIVWRVLVICYGLLLVSGSNLLWLIVWRVLVIFYGQLCGE